ncbi:hypothetical protein ABZW18_21330 [Streptomyces sp. NPDC004647]|uniref:hypothetical protein n=1 Tax=Streptomyces sp. NPDC004647 TaxID=3154671 RepID=UPI0033A28B1E
MGEAQLALRDFLARLSDEGGSLPGRRTDDGTLEVNWSHLTRLLDTSANYFGIGRPSRRIVQESGLPICERILLDTPITGRVGQQPWRTERIAYDEVQHLCRLLTMACFIVVSYLSGALPPVVLNLERGCITYDEAARLWLMNGRRWKGATDEDGTKIPEGEERHDPWTVIELVARAVSVLERLHDRRLLFPVLLDERRNVGGSAARRRPGQALTGSAMGEDITQFIAWVNAYCDSRGWNQERIPDDPAGVISPSRFRRTLAWHIVRRPRGLVACAIQYSHVNVAITLGYGTYESGFPDDHAYEQWLSSLEQLAEDEERLAKGEHVSGPAAYTYRHRVHGANARFAGRVLTTRRAGPRSAGQHRVADLSRQSDDLRLRRRESPLPAASQPGRLHPHPRSGRLPSNHLPEHRLHRPRHRRRNPRRTRGSRVTPAPFVPTPREVTHRDNRDRHARRTPRRRRPCCPSPRRPAARRTSARVEGRAGARRVC